MYAFVMRSRFCRSSIGQTRAFNSIQNGLAGQRVWRSMNLSLSKRNKKEKPPESPALWFTRKTLEKAFALGGCAICIAVHAAERKGIHSFLYEGMMFPGVRQKFLEGGGFCLRHFLMAKEIEDESWATGGIGMAILCEDLTRLAETGLTQVATVERNSKSSLLKRREARPFRPGHDCIFCQDNRDKERFLAEVLEELIEEQDFRKPLAEHGLCIRHGQLAVELWKNPEKWQKLFVQLKARTSEPAADLREFIRKHDYQCRNEPVGREHDSVPRAIRCFVGPNPCRPRAKKEAR
jgi:hypothetical protein